jgi:hypothetical protein
VFNQILMHEGCARGSHEEIAYMASQTKFDGSPKHRRHLVSFYRWKSFYQYRAVENRVTYRIPVLAVPEHSIPPLRTRPYPMVLDTNSGNDLLSRLSGAAGLEPVDGGFEICEQLESAIFSGPARVGHVMV